MRNFVTYQDAEVYPGEKLNVVVGPNGSGKSSIVCALALGLGEKPAILGRSKKVSEYIRHGASEAIIEIELIDESGVDTVAFQRVIKGDDSSVWKVNGKVTSLSRVQARLKSFHIQLDNLCQFLPQDKVASFTKMSPQELLINTEKALDEDGLYKKHMELIDFQSQLGGNKTKDAELAAEIGRLKEEHQLLERQVEMLNAQQQVSGELNVLKQKLPWVEYDMKREEALVLRQTYREARASKERWEEQNIEGRAERSSLEKELGELGTKRNALGAKALRLDRERQTASKHVDDETVAYDSLKKQLDGLAKREEKRQRELAKLRRDIEGLKREIAAVPDVNVAQAKIKDLRVEVAELRGQKKERTEEMEDVIAEMSDGHVRLKDLKIDLKRLENQKDRTLHTLFTMQTMSERIYQIAHENGERFQGKVLGPLASEIRVQNQLNGKVIENLMNRNLQYAYVFEHSEDEEVFRNLVRKEKLPLPQTIVGVKYDPQGPHKCVFSRQEVQAMKQAGIVHFASDIFSADPLIKGTVCSMTSCQNIGIMERHQEEEVKKLLISSLPIRQFVTSKMMFTISVSNHTKARNSRQSNLRPGRVIGTSGDADGAAVAEKQRELERLSAIHAGYQKTVRDCKADVERMGRKMKDLLKEISTLKEGEHLLGRCRKQLAYREKMVEELEGEEQLEVQEQALEAQIKEVLENRLKLMERVVRLTKEIIIVDEELTQLDLERIIRQRKLEQLDRRIESYRVNLEELAKVVQECKKSYELARRKTQELRDVAQQIAPLTDALKEAFKQIPDTLSELKGRIAEREARLDVQGSVDESCVERFARVTEKLNAAELDLERVRSSLSKSAEVMAELEREWMEPLQRLVGELNTHYCSYFSRLNCGGSVELSRGDTYDQYGLQLLVQFREDDALHQLNAKQQSGGEKSVCTMLFLISMQRLADQSFRLVDEINQGMDPANERMVFQIMVDVMSSSNVPQYFMITPKLLPNLEFQENCTVLCVFNGPSICNQETFSSYAAQKGIE